MLRSKTAGALLIAAALAVNCMDNDPTRPVVTSGQVVDGSTVPSRIAFVSMRDGNPEIYVMAPDGSAPTRLTDSPARDGHPSWSPDGRRIAFARSIGAFPQDGGLNIYVMASDGSAPTRLTTGYDDKMPTWSPDGRQIAFASDQNDYAIMVMNADGSAQTRVTPFGGTSRTPAWSPGPQIAFSFSSFSDGIYVIDADGSDRTRLTNFRFDSEPDWSPDGRQIAFETNRDGNSEIYVMNADGSAPTRLTNHPAYDLNPSWSPDGRQIAFESDRDGNREIYVMNADGSVPTRLTNDPAPDFQPDWSPRPPDDVSPVLATDAFNRANENPIAGNWTSGLGVAADLQLLNNAVKATNDADPNAVAFWNAITWPADQWSEVTIQTRGTSGDAGPAVRIAPTVATYYLAPVFADGRLEIWRSINHSFTRLRAGVPGTVVAGDRVRLEAEGTVLRVFKNGVLVGEAVDGAIAAGAAGIFQDHTSGVLDDWAGGAVGSSPPPPPPSPPAAPTNLATAAVSASQIDLTWADNATDEDGFRIERCAGVGCSGFAEIATVGANVVSYHNTGLTASTSYSYRVQAHNGAGTSAYSNTATATTSPPPAPGPLATDAFDRANENPIAGNWTSGPGVAADLQLLNNAVKATNDADPNAVAFWNAVTWPADQWSEVTIQTRGTSGDAGPAVRIAAGVATYYLAPVFADGRVEIWRALNHSFTRLRAGVPGTVVAGDRIRLEAEGTVLRVFKNGVLVGEVVDGAIAAGAAGLFQDHTSGVLDDWAGGAVAPPPAASAIAFTSNRDVNFDIYVMDPDGSAQTRLTSNEDSDIDPSWSPDGRHIAFVAPGTATPPASKKSI